MRHHNSVFRDLLDNLPWAVLDRLVTVHRADHRVRSLTTRHQLVALLYGQFSGAASLREIEGGLESHAARLYHVGGRTVSRSTFADAHAERPIYAAVSAANINDITAAHAMPVEAGATYVFDLGYYDYGWWARLDAAGCRIVTRFKANTKLTVTAELHVPEGGAILSDRIGLLPRRQAKSRRNPFSDPVREICVRIDSGKVLRRTAVGQARA